MTRRTLLGTGGVAAVGAGAVVVGESERGRRWLHAAGLLRGPDLPPPDLDVPVDRRVLDSDRMGRSLEWAVAKPPVLATAMIVCLHGRNESHAFAFDTIGVHRFVAAARRPWAVASVDGGPSSYWHQRGGGQDPEAMIFEELLPELRRTVGDVPTVLLGWSMGGSGALLAASDHGDEVVAAAVASPALWRDFSAAASGAFDSEDDFTAHDVFGRLTTLRQRPVRIDCGRDDPFAATAKQLAAAIGAESDFGDGFHDAGYWRSRVPAQLEFFGRALDP